MHRIGRPSGDTLLVVFWSSLSLAIGVVCYWRQAHRLVERL